MAFSYSFHLSGKSHSVNTVGKVAQCSRHNLREYESTSYDRSKIEVLVGSDKSILDDVKQIYHDEFDEVVERYNEGKRSDRQISDYLTHVSNSRADVGAEIIIQVGDKNFWSDKTMEEKKQMSYIFRDQLRALEKLCPEFKVASAVVHYDEASPHMHVIGVPIAEGYKKGMERQVAKTKVFTADRLSYLQDKMRENMEMGMEMNSNLFQDMKLKEKEKGRNKDIPKAALDEYYKLKQEVEENKDVLDRQNDRIDSNKEMIRHTDMAARSIADGSRSVVIEGMRIPERKTFLGKVESPERKGVFIEGVTKKQAESVVDHIRAGEGLERTVERSQMESEKIIARANEEAGNVLKKAEDEAGRILENARDTVQQAQEILKHRDSIIEKAKKLADRVNELLGRKKELSKEIDDIEAYRRHLEPLKAEYEALSNGVKVMSGELDHQLTRAKFKDWSTMRYGSDYDAYRKRGELIALYEDGTVRKVGYNRNGGWDDKTLNDQRAGLCRVGIMQEEERVRVPISLLKELVQVRDKEKPVSKELGNLIKQQEYAEKVVSIHKKHER